VDNGTERIFVVTGKFSNSGLSRGRNFGDDYGERYRFTEHVPASSPEDAVAQLEQTFHDQINRRNELMATFHHYRLIPIPDIPCDIKDWKAKELEIPGYRIILEKVA